MYCLVVFLRIFASLRSSFFEFGKSLSHPRELDHHFCPRAGELDEKIVQVAGIRWLKKVFPGVARVGDVPNWN